MLEPRGPAVPGNTPPTDRYEQRKAERQRLARDWQPGRPLPVIAYLPEEHSLWETVTTKLDALHREWACGEYLRAVEAVAVPHHRVPQLTEVSALLAGHGGFRLLPAEGTVPAERFYGAFADDSIYATQFLRSPETPFHSPEPDLIHEIVGHAVMLADPTFADLYRRFGQAARRVTTERGMLAITQLFWFTMEIGVVREETGLKAYGAALLSSVAELESLPRMQVLDFDVERVLRQRYDDSQVQPVVFAAESVTQLATELSRFLDAVD